MGEQCMQKLGNKAFCDRHKEWETAEKRLI